METEVNILGSGDSVKQLSDNRTQATESALQNGGAQFRFWRGLSNADRVHFQSLKAMSNY